jgi:outer membrane protein
VIHRSIKKSLSLLAVFALLVPSAVFAQGKIAVVNLQEAILQSDAAQQRLAQIRSEESYKADKSEFDRLQEELNSLVQGFQKDAAVMSQEQQLSARKRQIGRAHV